LGASTLTLISTQPICPSCCVELLGLLGAFPRLAATIRTWDASGAPFGAAPDDDGPLVESTPVFVVTADSPPDESTVDTTTRPAAGDAVALTTAPVTTAPVTSHPAAEQPVAPLPIWVDPEPEPAVPGSEPSAPASDHAVPSAQVPLTPVPPAQVPVTPVPPTPVTEDYDDDQLDELQHLLADRQSPVDPRPDTTVSQPTEAHQPDAGQPEPGGSTEPELAEEEEDMPDVVDVEEGQYDDDLLDAVRDLLADDETELDPGLVTELQHLVDTDAETDAGTLIVDDEDDDEAAEDEDDVDELEDDEGEYDDELLDSVEDMLAEHPSDMDPELVQTLVQLIDADAAAAGPATDEADADAQATDEPGVVHVDEGEYDDDLLESVAELLDQPWSTVDPQVAESVRQMLATQEAGANEEPVVSPAEPAQPTVLAAPEPVPAPALEPVAAAESVPTPEPVAAPEPPVVVHVVRTEPVPEPAPVVVTAIATPTQPPPADQWPGGLAEPEPPAATAADGPDQLIAHLVQSARDVVAFLPDFTVVSDRGQADHSNTTLQRLTARLEERFAAVDRAGIDVNALSDDAIDAVPAADGHPVDAWEAAVARGLLHGTRLSIARQDASGHVVGQQLVGAFARLRVAEPSAAEAEADGPIRREWQALRQNAPDQPAALATVTLPNGTSLSAMTSTGEESLVRAYVGTEPDSSRGRLPRYVAYPVGADDATARQADAEKKIFEYLVTNYEPELDSLKNALITIVCTEAMCPSCVMVALQFLTDFEGLVVTVRLSAQADRGRPRWFRGGRA
jgi:hypothetical protein